ncbi:type II secretion system protein GspC, partial [Ectothiorhodospira mobilis]|uniref:type II secretion system protein GspC n=1 Tax=Ectothiorhodospira mobilis TaxID=195064 RepID=UPI001907183B
VNPMPIPLRSPHAGLAALACEPARAAPWATALLVVLLGISLAQLTWRIPAPLAGVPLADTEAMDVPPVTPGAREGARLETVAGLHLFGRAPREGAARAVPVEAPETRLRLELKGVVALQTPDGGAALIAGEGEDERHYRVGDDLPGGATLEQILPDRVILSRDGRFEMLRLPRQRLEAHAVNPIPVEGDAGLASALAQRRQDWLREPRRFMEVVRVRPVMADGRLKGFAVSPRREAALFRRAGLEPGDVVTAINGRDLASVGDPRSMIKELASASAITLEVEREGRSRTLTLPLGP